MLEPPERPKKRLAFRPPKRSALWLGLCELFLPTILKRGFGIESVHYEPHELERFRHLTSERLLITPNHPTHAEPVVMFHLAKTVGRPFYYLSNREGFGLAWGLLGFLLQRCGAYSILRGAPDRESFKTTRRILSQAMGPLVIFPEGEVYSQNDSLLPFQAGVFQLAFLAMDDMGDVQPALPLFVQPVAIRYRFTQDMGRQIVESMDHLERHLSLDGPPPGDTYSRLRRIGDAVLTSAERTYDLPHGSSDDLNPRIDAVRNKIVERVADALHLDPESLGPTLPDKMRGLMNRLSGVVPDDTKVDSTYHARLVEEEATRNRPLIRDLKRLSNWLAVRDGYVGENPTQERMVDTLWRLESEVLGRRMIKGRRQCSVRLPEPIDLREYGTQFKENKREAVHAVTDRVEASIQAMLDEMGK
ncbi:MAG: 1-acyl-sn-glycerol-3-phosphate acyltransferase [Armatimonadetes bacterium]|nr:1-acyl-sn-glycerol-3-phosphate acyltransferase [Armatimonadota bacterium]